MPWIPLVLALWTGLYFWMMGSAGWPFAVENAPNPLYEILGFGSVPPGTLTRFGSAMPERIHNGDWQRVFTAASLQPSLLGLLLLGWFWVSVVRGLRGLTGMGAIAFVMIAGGAGGCWVHAHLYPETQFAAPGPFGWVVALIGLQMGLGLFGKVPRGRRLVGSAVASLVFVGALTWMTGGEAAFASETLRPALGLEALGTSLGLGLLLPLLLGAPRIARRAHPLATPLGLVACGAFVAACAVQLPRTIQAGDAGQMTGFLEALRVAEVDTRAVYDDHRHVQPHVRDRARASLGAVAEHDFVKQLDDETLLTAYLQTLHAIARGELVDPHGALFRAQRAFEAWYEGVEKTLRRDYGLRPRPPHELRTWTRM